MTRWIRDGELRLYLRDHKWWWKWPLVATTMGVWVGAMVLFVAPWQSNASIDLSQDDPVTTTENDQNTTIGVHEALDPAIPDLDQLDTDDAEAALLTPESTADTEPPDDTEAPDETEPPADTEAPAATAVAVAEAVQTEVTQASRRRPARTVRADVPEPATTTTTTVAPVVTAAPPTTRPPIVRTPIANRPTTTVAPTTTVRPTTTPPPPTTQPPPPPTTQPPPPPTTQAPPPPTTAPPAPPPPPPPDDASPE